MRILLLNPPFFPKYSRSSRSPAVTKGGTIYYPLWLAYATGVLEQAGHECKLVDAPASGKCLEEVKEIAREFAPELVVCDTSTPSIYNDVKVVEELKKQQSFFSVLVGTHASALPVKTLKLSKAIDAIAVHEYDYTLRELAKKVGGKKTGPGTLAKVNGIAFFDGKKFLKTGAREPIADLDSMPFVSSVYKKHLNIRDYFYSANLYPEVTVISGRGCPFKCKFCHWVHVLNKGGYRTRSVKNVVDELEFIEREFPEAKEVFLEDDTFTADSKRVNKFCDEKIRKGVKIKWSCNARADVPVETLKKMKKAGCRLLCVGFESGSQDILNKVSKGTTLANIKRFMGDTRKAGVLVHGCFMVGNAGETVETIRGTIELAKELNPDTAQFFPIMVYPGTPTYDYFKEQGWLVTKDFSKWVDEKGWHNCMVSRPGLSSKALVQWCNRARKEFYLRPSYIASKVMQAITHPKEAKRIFKSGAVFARALIKGGQ